MERERVQPEHRVLYHLGDNYFWDFLKGREFHVLPTHSFTTLICRSISGTCLSAAILLMFNPFSRKVVLKTSN